MTQNKMKCSSRDLVSALVISLKQFFIEEFENEVSFQKLRLNIFKWLSPIGLCLINTTYQDRISCDSLQRIFLNILDCLLWDRV